MEPIDPERGTLNDQQFWAQPWLVTTVLMQIACIFIYSQRQGINAFDPWIYLLSVGTGVSFWLLMNLLRDYLGRTGRIVVGVVLAPLITIIIVGNYLFYQEFGEYFSASMVKFAVAGNAGMSLHYAAGYLDLPQMTILLAGTGGFAALWIYGRPVRFTSSRARRRAALGAAGVFAVSLTLTNVVGPRHNISPDTSLMSALTRAVILPKANNLRGADRETVPARKPTDESASEPPPNVVVVVNESWAKRHVGFYDGEDNTMPFMKSWIERESDSFFVYDRAYTHSTTTELSMPSIMTGVGPWESGEKLHRVPFVWEWARSAGLQPFFLTAQSYDFLGYGEFFFERETLPVQTVDDIDHKRTDDFGVDELGIVEHFGTMLEEHTGGERFFGIYNSDALHKPVQTKSPRLEDIPSFDAEHKSQKAQTGHKKALYIVDQTMKSIVEDIREAGQMDNTVFIFTSDHGELPTRKHLPPRVVSFYEEFTNIPFLIRVPPSWTEKYPERVEALRTNQSRMVANTDVLPTIIEVLGVQEAAPQLWDALSGRSLVEPVSEDRTIIGLNTNDIRRWEHEGFGLYWKNWRLVVSDIEGAQLFDISEDPDQQNNVWHDAPTGVRRHFQHMIEHNHHLERIWNSYR